jgi:hypothetical protein
MQIVGSGLQYIMNFGKLKGRGKCCRWENVDYGNVKVLLCVCVCVCVYVCVYGYTYNAILRVRMLILAWRSITCSSAVFVVACCYSDL